MLVTGYYNIDEDSELKVKERWIIYNAFLIEFILDYKLEMYVDDNIKSIFLQKYSSNVVQNIVFIKLFCEVIFK